MEQIQLAEEYQKDGEESPSRRREWFLTFSSRQACRVGHSIFQDFEGLS
jgi:hypothetical protein